LRRKRGLAKWEPQSNIHAWIEHLFIIIFCSVYLETLLSMVEIHGHPSTIIFCRFVFFTVELHETR
jgi:hypothetical protein